MMASLVVPTTAQLEFGDMVVMSGGEKWQQVIEKFERLIEIGGPDFVQANVDAFDALQDVLPLQLMLLLRDCLRFRIDAVRACVADNWPTAWTTWMAWIGGLNQNLLPTR